jgi:hypothetical protein
MTSEEIELERRQIERRWRDQRIADLEAEVLAPAQVAIVAGEEVAIIEAIGEKAPMLDNIGGVKLAQWNLLQEMRRKAGMPVDGP